MAQSKKSKSKKKVAPLDERIHDFLSSQKTKNISAAIFFILSVAFLVSYISFLNTWQEDQSVLDMSIFSYLFNTDIKCRMP